MSISASPQVHKTPDVPSRVISPRECERLLRTGGLSVKVVDLRPVSNDSSISNATLPGAVRLSYQRLVKRSGFAEGMLPDETEISELLGELGITPEDFVIAYDANNGISATRFLWTLDVVSHGQHALLDGGFEAWKKAGLPVVHLSEVPEPTLYPVSGFGDAVASKEYVLESIDHPDRVIVDNRSYGEFTGEDELAMRGGHIPGAVHYDWTNSFDSEIGRFRNPAELESELISRGITRDREIIVYCQSNRRSANVYNVLKWLDYPRVRAYTGSWSEWGNDDDLPVQTGV